MGSRQEVYRRLLKETPGFEDITEDQVKHVLEGEKRWIESDLFYEAMEQGDKVSMRRLKGAVLKLLAERSEQESNPGMRRVLDLEKGAIEELAGILLKALQ